MNYKINLTPKSQSDLKEIFRYIAVDLQSIQNATGQFDRLEKAISSLEQMPERYRVYDKEPWRSRNLRIMTVDNYLVLYVPNKEERTVTVIRIMYGGRDIDSQLNFNK